MSMLIKFIAVSIASGTPILFGTLGEIITEKVGHLNLGVEGMMAIGACAGFMAGMSTDSFVIALLAAFAAGALSALLYAVLTVTFMANQNVTGLTLTIFGVGLANFCGYYAIGKSETGTLKLPEGITSQMRNVNIPGLSDIPVIGPLLFSYNPFVYIGIAMAFILWFYLHRTKTGLNIRAIGENPAAADAAGIKVTKWKYINICLGGGICGIGGAYTIMIINKGVWISDCVGGLGWIAVALVIFASWSPVKAIFGSVIFGALRQLKYYVPAAIAIPGAFYDMLPYLITTIVLIATSIKMSREKSQPQSCGINYFREER
ncbi:MAG: ABC transporter permease [Lachnospiraceae bacterium]|nr:ABC transporter permease [Lachnospiraceae bacterium]